MTQTSTDALRLVPVSLIADTMTAMARAYERIHSLPRVSDTELAMRTGEAKERLRPYLSAPASPLPGGGDMDWQSVAMWMGFSASVIKNGEPWSDQCQQHYDEAKAAFARLAAPTGDARNGKGEG